MLRFNVGTFGTRPSILQDELIMKMLQKILVLFKQGSISTSFVIFTHC
jgi:hypothetical protein